MKPKARCDKMTVPKIHVTLFSSILILFCVRIAHTAPTKQQDSSDLKIVDLCLKRLTIINVASNDTGFILTSTSNCTEINPLFQFNYGNADANDAKVIFGWSSMSGISISTDDNDQIRVREVTANESYWNPGKKVYYFPNGHNVTLTVYKSCSKSNVTDESVKSERLASDARKQRFTCESSKKLVNNMNQFSDAPVLSCDLNTQTWEVYDVSCNGPLRCVDNSKQQPTECEVWRIHDDTIFTVTCSNANSADEPSFNIQCDNQLVLGILDGSFRSEIDTLEVTCKGASGSKSWFTSTNELIPPSIQYGCSMGAAVTNSTEKDIEKYESMIAEQNTTIVKQNKAIVEQNKTIGGQKKVIEEKTNVICGVSASLGVIGVYAISVTVVAYFKHRKHILWEKLPKTKSDAVTPMGLVDGSSPFQSDSDRATAAE